jgi:hypothetical protein
MTDAIIAENVNVILHACAKILQAKKESISQMPVSDQKAIKVTGSTLMRMLQVTYSPDAEYLNGLAHAVEESFIDDRDHWVDALALNQGKIVGLMMDGANNERNS